MNYYFMYGVSDIHVHCNALVTGFSLKCWPAKCAVPEKMHTHPKEGHWKFLGGQGSVKSQNFESKVWSLTGISWGGGGCKTKKLSLG